MSTVDLGAISLKHPKVEKHVTGRNITENTDTYNSNVGASSTINITLTSDATTSLRTKIAMLDLNRAVGNSEKIVPPPIGPGQPSTELSAALRKGLVGPENWLSQSDLDLFHKVTGKIFNNGVLIDKNGQKSELNKSESDLLTDLYQARNYGILGEHGFTLMSSKDIRSEDIENMLKYVKLHNPEKNLLLLERASEILLKEENKTKETATLKTMLSSQSAE